MRLQYAYGLRRFALLLVSSSHRLAVSAASGASAVRPTPVPGTGFVSPKEKTARFCGLLFIRPNLLVCAVSVRPIRNIVALLAWSASHCSLFLHLTASLFPPQAALRRFAPRRSPARASFPPKKKQPAFADCFFFGGEGETRAPAPVTRPTPLAGAPRHQLEYFSMVTYI